MPVKHIQPGEEKILEERYLTEREQKKEGKGGKGGKGVKGSPVQRKKNTRLNPQPKLPKKTPPQHLSHPQLAVVD